jgi:hypothetical protein
MYFIWRAGADVRRFFVIFFLPPPPFFIAFFGVCRFSPRSVLSRFWAFGMGVKKKHKKSGDFLKKKARTYKHVAVLMFCFNRPCRPTVRQARPFWARAREFRYSQGDKPALGALCLLVLCCTRLKTPSLTCSYIKE